MVGGRKHEGSIKSRESLLRVPSVYGKVVQRCSNGNVPAVRKRSSESDAGNTPMVEKTFSARPPILQQQGSLMMTQQDRSPIKEFRAASIKAAIWSEEHKEQGRSVVRHTVRIQKRYRDKDSGEWRTTEYFFPNDLPRLCLVAEKAFEYIALNESTDEPAVDR